MLLGTSYFLGVLSVAVVGTYVFFQRQAKDALAGCWYILRDGAYATGDYILVGSEEGFVSEVGLYRTILKDAWNLTKRTIIHHSFLNEQTLQVKTWKGEILYDEVFYSAYDAQPSIARMALNSATSNLRKVFSDTVLLSVYPLLGPKQDRVGYEWRVRLLISVDEPSRLNEVASMYTELVREEFAKRGLRIPSAHQADVFFS